MVASGKVIIIRAARPIPTNHLPPPAAAATFRTMNWLAFALMTVVSWGVYGIFLHSGQMGMNDPVNGRYKAFLFVGIAYFLTAVIAPLVMLLKSGADWNYPRGGMWWSLLAGIVGAIGAFCVLLAFGAKGSPTVVMTIVFAGAPIVNAVVAILQHPPEGGWSAIKPQFYLGIALAALGGCLVTYYKPNPAPAKPQAAFTQSTSPETMTH
jgi:drug/metabolite transporter (DMT)-like permease